MPCVFVTGLGEVFLARTLGLWADSFKSVPKC